MKINDISRDLGIGSTSAESLQSRKVDRQQEEVTPVEEQGQGEEVSISSASVEFSRAAEMMEKESPERAMRIQELQKAVQDGTYEVDSAKVAEKILKSILSE
ncbi:MAG: flagellar biosynthesis anti-sigma factor FlgM [Deltaproteobacteria bacterium HGW-Deltaproteobacteria-15]|jgi:flagellar biosynthesis anti-sigma factor FlgM|nr:MAG: flagellar biosynthesis anti-sigma factor FlgM [Deltaproteobacteria bacterium HGW-Deltaproteobacteria-15]